MAHFFDFQNRCVLRFIDRIMRDIPVSKAEAIQLLQETDWSERDLYYITTSRQPSALFPISTYDRLHFPDFDTGEHDLYIDRDRGLVSSWADVDKDCSFNEWIQRRQALQKSFDEFDYSSTLSDLSDSAAEDLLRWDRRLEESTGCVVSRDIQQFRKKSSS